MEETYQHSECSSEVESNAAPPKAVHFVGYYELTFEYIDSHDLHGVLFLEKIYFSAFHDHQCEKHGIFDSLPCPWPYCQNGVSGNEFKLLNYPLDNKPTIYQRHTWISTDGEEYCSWGLKDYPCWFTAKKTFWAEARRKGLTNIIQDKTIYHYTSIDGLMGILSSRSIWLTDYSYLNDRREIEHGVDVACEAAEAILEKQNNDSVNELLNSWIVNLKNMNERVCIASFSASGDSLSQWRAYGNIAIGLKASEITRHAREVIVQPVEYIKQNQFKLAQLYLSHLCQSYLKDSLNKSLERIHDIYHRTGQVIELISFFKDSSFQDEHEYRAVFIEHDGVAESLGLEKPKKNFRSINGHLIPYVSSGEIYPLDGYERPLEIEEIVLGPTSDKLLERGVRDFLQELEMSHIPIRLSRVPYRT